MSGSAASKPQKEAMPGFDYDHVDDDDRDDEWIQAQHSPKKEANEGKAGTAQKPVESGNKQKKSKKSKKSKKPLVRKVTCVLGTRRLTVSFRAPSALLRREYFGDGIWGAKMLRWSIMVFRVMRARVVNWWCGRTAKFYQPFHRNGVICSREEA
jgi:hypothetical protein